MRQSTTQQFWFDNEVLNVHYFEFDGSLHIDDAQDNAVQVYGVTREHLIRLARNIFCCKDGVEPRHITEPHQWKQLEELHEAIGVLLEANK